MRQKLPSDSVRDWMVKVTADQLELPEDVVDMVITDSYRETVKAVRTHDEIEISGFGKIFISTSKLKKRIAKIEKYLSGNIPDEKRKIAEEDLVVFKTKLHEVESRRNS